MPGSTVHARHLASTAFIDSEHPGVRAFAQRHAVGVDASQRAVALYPYKASKTDELDFEKGDCITVTRTVDGGWWEGRLGDKLGWFPSNYVAIEDEAALVRVVVALEKKRVDDGVGFRGVRAAAVRERRHERRSDHDRSHCRLRDSPHSPSTRPFRRNPHDRFFRHDRSDRMSFRGGGQRRGGLGGRAKPGRPT
jgi:hypothetical protein